MPRRVRYDTQFLEDLQERVRGLARHRPAEQRANLEQALERFVRRVAQFPGMSEEVSRRGSTSYRVGALSEPLPYIVYYAYDEADAAGPVTLLMLLHESQDRARFDPGTFDE